jgi:preprotein translocase subunit YajC
MLKCRINKLNLLFRVESHSSSGGITLFFLKSLSIFWFAMTKRDEKERKKAPQRE